LSNRGSKKTSLEGKRGSHFALTWKDPRKKPDEEELGGGSKRDGERINHEKDTLVSELNGGGLGKGALPRGA